MRFDCADGQGTNVNDNERKRGCGGTQCKKQPLHNSLLRCELWQVLDGGELLSDSSRLGDKFTHATLSILSARLIRRLSESNDLPLIHDGLNSSLSLLIEPLVNVIYCSNGSNRAVSWLFRLDSPSSCFIVAFIHELHSSWISIGDKFSFRSAFTMLWIKSWIYSYNLIVCHWIFYSNYTRYSIFHFYVR